jgi:peptidoglycan lytic transglycosylase
MPNRGIIAVFVCGALLAACHTPEFGSGLPQVGLASWYGPHFQRKRTANGERFNMNGLTAAHRTLPFNAYVRVTNLANGRSVIVRINDRGPFVGDRIIDLSAKAARELGIEEDGVARVRLELVSTTRANL